MIKITLIFGEGAVRKYDESKELPSKSGCWIMGASWTRKRSEPRRSTMLRRRSERRDGWTDYRIIRHKDEPEDTDTSHEEAVWLRLGVTVQAP